MASRHALFGRISPAIAVEGACIVPIVDDAFPDPFLVEEHEGHLLIGQARPLRIAGIDHRCATPAQDLFTAWRRWNEESLSRISGDFLLLDWDIRARMLRIARAPLSEFNLFIQLSHHNLRFATIAPALGATEPDLAHLALQTSGRPLYGTISTGFVGVETLPPGSLTTFSAAGKKRSYFWHPQEEHDEVLPDRQAAERLRSALIEATGELLEGGGDVVSSHLSAGRDSGATSAVAAYLLGKQNRKLLACTAVPRAGYEHIDDQYLYDEGPAAAILAGQYPNIMHRRLITPTTRLGALLDTYNQVLQAGHGTPVSLGWWSHGLEVAANAGASTLLSGGLGNFTISSGGPWVLPDLLRAAQIRAWSRTVVEASAYRDASIKNIAATSFMPFIPDSFAASLSGFRYRRRRSGRHFYRGSLANARSSVDASPSKHRAMFYREQQFDALRTYDLSDPEPWAFHRLSLRDPTGDRRVVRAALSLTPEQIASAYDRRPIYELAFADFMPTKSLRQPLRGHQAADWNHYIDVAELRTSVRRYGEHRLVRELVDVPALLNALGQWPEGDCIGGPKYALLVNAALPAISTASFLNLHFPS